QSSSSDVDPLAYLAKSSTQPQPSPKPTTQASQTHEEALMATTQQLANLLNAEAEAFLADVECTAPYEGQLAMTT
nr:hypothetical protein [Tanacetum cinerariifolium]